MEKQGNPVQIGEEQGGYVVRRPAPTDAIGDSLRHAFDKEWRLPADFARMLDSLDRIN